MTDRLKVFGHGPGTSIDRNAKARIMHLARALTKPTQPNKHYGQVTAKALTILGVLLYQFCNGHTGRCFPSYERIAEAAACSIATVHTAINMLEGANLITWVNSWERRRVETASPTGQRHTAVMILRGSNNYSFLDPMSSGHHAPPSKPKIQRGTSNQVRTTPVQNLEADRQRFLKELQEAYATNLA